MRIFAIAASSLSLVLKTIQAMPVSEKLSILNADITKVNVGKGKLVDAGKVRAQVLKGKK